MARSQNKGTWTHRLLTYVFTLLLGLLIYWLLDFILADIGNLPGPSYAELEAEMLENTWLSVPANPELVFDVPFEDRWQTAAGVLGIDLSRLSPDAGHA